MSLIATQKKHEINLLEMPRLAVIGLELPSKSFQVLVLGKKKQYR